MSQSEVAIHTRYKAQRGHGEWFVLSGGDIATIAITLGGDTEGDSSNHPTAHAQARAESVFVSDSYSASEVKEKTSLREIPKRELSSAGPDGGFPNWWRMWSCVRGSNHRMQAEHAYQTWVEPSMEAACLECTQSYLQSLENPAKGYNPENFLMEQSREKFAARWPTRSPPKRRKSIDELVEEMNAEERGRIHDG